MNRQIAQLAVFTLVLLAALIVGTTYWQTWAAAGLADRQDNAIMRVAQFTIKRGEIKSADGTVLATNVAKRVEGHTLYFRRYPQGALFAHLIGYSTQSRSRAGLERSENSYLTGADANLTSLYNTTINQLKGVTVKGNDLHLTVRAGAQRLAMGALAGQCGAAVALDSRTGKVLVMASQPSYDPNLVEELQPDPARAQSLHAWLAAPEPRHGRPLLARFHVQGGDRLRGAEHGPLHDRLDLQGPGLLHRVRQARAQLPRPERSRSLRERQLHPGAPALD